MKGINKKDQAAMIIPIKNTDQEMIRSYPNVPSTRNMMFNTHKKDALTHQKWFNAVLKDKVQRFFIFRISNIPLAMLSFSQINLEQKAEEWELYKAPNTPKGAGYLLVTKALENNSGFPQINARMCSINEKGWHLHQKLGFSKNINVKIIRTNEGDDIYFYIKKNYGLFPAPFLNNGKPS